ncbi:flagellar protein FlaG [Motilimonas sp. KMU-193]|uniref:flagellar protein FlaG n=1 Tax=Motilimonas sp. KMU-193 TaxID=3388668 RepID=UPI00396B1565
MKANESTAASFVLESYSAVKLPKEEPSESNSDIPLVTNESRNSLKVHDTALSKSESIAQGNRAEKVEKESVEEAVSLVQRFLDGNKRGVNFSIDDSTDKTVIKVTDTQTKELVRQLPSEEMLRIAEKIKELEQELTNKVGILIDSKA